PCRASRWHGCGHRAALVARANLLGALRAVPHRRRWSRAYLPPNPADHAAPQRDAGAHRRAPRACAALAVLVAAVLVRLGQRPCPVAPAVSPLPRLRHHAPALVDAAARAAAEPAAWQEPGDL